MVGTLPASLPAPSQNGVHVTSQTDSFLTLPLISRKSEECCRGAILPTLRKVGKSEGYGVCGPKLNPRPPDGPL